MYLATCPIVMKVAAGTFFRQARIAALSSLVQLVSEMMPFAASATSAGIDR